MTQLKYWQLQLVAWTLVFVVMVSAIAMRPIVVNTEFFYAVVLIAATGCLSHLIRWLYKTYLDNLSLVKQGLSLFALSLLCAATSTMILVAAVFAVSYSQFAFPIPAQQRWFVVQQVFVGNWINMSGLLVMWSSLYFAITKVRVLRSTQKALEQTQLEVLHNQLNPHFLFNALNNIRALVLEDREKSRDMLSCLSDILRYSLSQDKQAKVTLEEEMFFINNYIELCKIQFEERLRFNAVIESDLARCLVPKMMLQLCVENAVKHGVEANIEGGEVSLIARKKDEKMHFTIANSVGSSTPSAPSLGIGVKNLKSRLQLIYGNTAGVSLQQHQHTFEVNIVTPMEVVK